MDNILVELQSVLQTTPSRWQSLAQHFSETLLRRQPAPGEWSALECLQHLIDLDRTIFPDRVRALLAGEDFPAFFPDEQGTPLAEDVPAAALAETFAALRADNLRLLATITPADLDRQGRHSELGLVTLGNLLHEWGGHDLMQPFIAGCGPWQIYFTQHKAPGA